MQSYQCAVVGTHMILFLGGSLRIISAWNIPTFRLLWLFSEGSNFIIFGQICHFRRAEVSLFSAILAVFGRRYFYYLRPFWPFSEGSIFIILGHFVVFRGAYFSYYFRPLWPYSDGGVFLLFGKCCPFRTAALLLFSGILSIFGRGWLFFFFKAILAVFGEG